MKNLVIVESPTKAKTISRFLGSDYDIRFSMGHVMDLPKTKLGVDLDNDFAPQYEIMADKKKMITELRAAGKDAETIFLATDPDREGEAISANIQELLKGKTKTDSARFKRIVFHEITEEAIKHAIESPRLVDDNLVNAQTARRVLDRLVGYKLSPLLWKKVRRGLSAGRVQSVALRLIVEREREIEKFQKEPYFTIHATLEKKPPAGHSEFDLIEINGEKIEKSQTYPLYDGEFKSTKTILGTPERAAEITRDMQTKDYVVADVQQKQTKRSPLPPFTTSTLQQEASRRFGYAGKRTMSLAQKLYEEGHITYHRTDSTVLATTAVDAIRGYVVKEFGEKYIPEKNRFFATKQKGAQEAHEAIRPTKFDVSGASVTQSLGADYGKLYDLIWRRAVSSQMSDALIESTSVIVDTTDKAYRLKTNGSVLVFDGFLKINPQALADNRLPQFVAGESLTAKVIREEPHETSAPPRYNDASLIATLEDKGIGRPSTYASIIGTIADRAYIERVEKRFQPTAIGMAVNDFLVLNFASIDDIPFTAGMELQLDNVADGKTNWITMMKDFYTPFEKKLIEVEGADRVKIAVEDTGEICPTCKEGHLVIRSGRFGKFISCGRFPECKYTKPLVKETDITCPKDGGNVIQRKTRKGRMFYGCSNYPACDFAVWKLEDIATYDPVAEAEKKAKFEALKAQDAEKKAAEEAKKPVKKTAAGKKTTKK